MQCGWKHCDNEHLDTTQRDSTKRAATQKDSINMDASITAVKTKEPHPTARNRPPWNTKIKHSHKLMNYNQKAESVERLNQNLKVSKSSPLPHYLWHC